MKRPHIAALLVALALSSGGAFLLGRHSGAPAPATPAAPARKVLYWQDPMVPGPRFDKPGKSPFMDMALQPVYADDAEDSGVGISPQVQQNLGIRTALVKRAETSDAVETTGTVQFDERLGVAVQTRVAGYLEQLAVRAPLERVSQGQTLGTVFAPEWLGPLGELLALKRAGAAPELIAAARERLRALSVPEALVQQSEASGSPQARFALTAPRSGVVAELGVREGVAVTPGLTLFRIAGLERVWAVAEVLEAQALQLRRGQRVTAQVQADPSRPLSGRLQEILPQVNANTRTVQARFEVDNPGGALLPGMLLRLRLEGPRAPRLLVPAEAVIRTGTRAVALLRRSDGRFEPRELQLGLDLGEQLEVREGLSEGDTVVASGQFLIDSEARLRSALGALAAPPAPPTPAASTAGATP